MNAVVFIDQRQDWHDARASLNRRFDESDLLGIVSDISSQLLTARMLGASPAAFGSAILDAIDAHLDRCADWAVDRGESVRPFPEDAARMALLRASVVKASGTAS